MVGLRANFFMSCPFMVLLLIVPLLSMGISLFFTWLPCLLAEAFDNFLEKASDSLFRDPLTSFLLNNGMMTVLPLLNVDSSCLRAELSSLFPP